MSLPIMSWIPSRGQVCIIFYLKTGFPTFLIIPPFDIPSLAHGVASREEAASGKDEKDNPNEKDAQVPMHCDVLGVAFNSFFPIKHLLWFHHLNIFYLKTILALHGNNPPQLQRNEIHQLRRHLLQRRKEKLQRKAIRRTHRPARLGMVLCYQIQKKYLEHI